jgi:exo-1,4-beta-D-glucosaminidase
MSRVSLLLLAALFLAKLEPAAAQPPPVHLRGPARIELNREWRIQSSAVATQPGSEISTARFDARSWYSARIPATVLATLVDHGVYPDPNFGMNLRSVPGTAYDIGDQFANVPVPPDSPFAVGWWHRTEFQLPAGARGQRVWLNFESINYSADIWLNGRRIASRGEVRGMYRTFEFDVTEALARGTNALAIEVFAAGENDLGLTFVDWNPLPADKDMGLVRSVYLLTGGAVAVRNVQVVSKVDNTLDQAHLTLFADVTNTAAAPVEGTLEAAIGGLAISKAVRLDPGEAATVAFTPAEFRDLNLRDPQLWWPYGLGPQTLHRLRMEFIADGAVSDRQEVEFGIREFTSELTADRHRLFRINGRRILIRGGGWTHDMLMRIDDEREERELQYVRDMRLNTVRLEGKMMTQHFYDTADRMGILVMPGWCCCGYFEQWPRWTADDRFLAGESLRSQLRLLRNHAGVFVFLYGSDESPDPPSEAVYLRVLQEERWPHPYLSSATDRTTVGAGWTGVKMTGPYDYVPPNYWLTDTRRGGAWGFNTETSPGHAIPVLSSLEEMLPADHLWPVDDVWNFHAASPAYPDMQVYRRALEARYGEVNGLADFVEKSQAMAYEGERAMFEAFGRNKYAPATGVIQWMLNNAWPSIVWHLYDYYLRPGGGYFGTKKANEPLHVQYSYDDRSIVVVNSTYESYSGYSVTAQVYNLDLTAKYSRTAAVNITPDSASRVFLVPEIDGLSRAYFVRLSLRDPSGALVSGNFYWLSTQPDVVDWDAQVDFRYTPVSQDADLTALQSLPPAKVEVTWLSEDGGVDRRERVTVRNTSSALALFVHLTLTKEGEITELAPVYWEDNYFELFPGEERQLTATYPSRLLGGSKPVIRVDGWNLK